MKQSMAADNLRSDCPVNYFVELAGDKWSLLIIRDIVFWGRVQSSQFRQAEEHIATNILTDRLSRLVNSGILKKVTDPQDRRRDNYSLTEKGIGLIPLLLDIIVWSNDFGPESLSCSKNLIADLQKNHQVTIDEIVALTRAGQHVFSRQGWQPSHAK